MIIDLEVLSRVLRHYDRFVYLRHGQFGPAASNATILLALFLSTDLPGLWDIHDIFIPNQNTKAPVNKWDRTWFANVSDHGGAAISLL